jgi:hypothetical protein
MTGPNPFAPPSELAGVAGAQVAAHGALHRLKLYSPNQVALGTFLGFPIAAGWLMAANYRAWGEPSKARTALFVGIAGTLALVVIAFLTPRSPGYSVMTLACTFAARALAMRLQGHDFTMTLVAGGNRYSSWRVVGIALFSVIFVLAVCFVGGLVVGLFHRFE